MDQMKGRSLLNSKEIAKRALLLADEKRALRKSGMMRRSIAGIVVVSAALTSAVISGLFQTGMELEDEPTPLAAPGIIFFPDMESLGVSGGATEAQITLENPGENGCNFIFEIILAETGEILYTSELVEPGKKIESVSLARPLEKGEYKAILKIKAYAIDGIEETGSSNFEFILNEGTH